MVRKMKPGLPNITFDEEESAPIGGLFNTQSGSLSKQSDDQRVIVQIPVHLIDPSPYQKRKIFDEKGLSDFADIMRRQGFTSVIWVRPNPNVYGRYELIYGERRWRAAKLVASDPEPKFTTISCEIKTDINDPFEILELGLIENGQRVDLAPSEEAQSFQEMLTLKWPDGSRAYTLEVLSETLKKSVSYIQDRLYLLELPEDVRMAYDRNDKIALRALREVTRIPSPEDRVPILELLVAGEFSVRAVREVIAEMALDQQQEQKEDVSSVAHDSVEVIHAGEALPDAELSEHADLASPTSTNGSQEQCETFTLASMQVDEVPTSGTVEIITPLSQSTKPGKAFNTFKGVISRDKKSIIQIYERWEKLSNEQGDDVRTLIQAAVDELDTLSANLRLPTID
jgi:ParB family chromosome partitioning protein